MRPRALLGEVGSLITEDIRRKRLTRRRRYVPAETPVATGPAAAEDDDTEGV